MIPYNKPLTHPSHTPYTSLTPPSHPSHTPYTPLYSGLVTLTWNNVNIDAYLHRITSSTSDLKRTNTIVQDILATQVGL